jgi:hypothetical protein
VSGTDLPGIRIALAVVAAAVLLSGCGSSSGNSSSSVAAPPAIALSVAPMTANVPTPVGTQSFTAAVQNDTSNKGVAWVLAQSGAPCSPACGTVSPSSSMSGAAILYTAPPTVPTNSAVTLTATSVADGTKSVSATVTLTAISVTVSPKSASVDALSSDQSFIATLQNDSQNLGVTWTLTQLGTRCSPTCGTLSPATSTSGAPIIYTAPAAVPSNPAVTLTATSVADGNKASSAAITVTTASIGISVALSPSLGGIVIGQALNFSATVTGDSSSAGVSWSSEGNGCSANACGSFTNIATPSVSTTYTAPSAPGIYTITATSLGNVSESASATIGVTNLAGVTTYHNNLSRDGVNAQEYALTTSNVAAATFGKLFSCGVDGAIYAQPLWIASVMINGETHNIVITATEHDSLYAFDADANPCIQLWHANLIDSGHGGNSGETSVPSGTTGFLVGHGGGNLAPEVGVTGTPVIDPSTNTIYVVSKSVIASGPTFFQRLHAIDLTTGNEKFSGPVAISATSPGTGDGGTIDTFNLQTQSQRSGLALVNGVVYIEWASHEDTPSYYGWIIGYNESTLAQVSVLNVTPNVGNAGLWMSGSAPAADSSNNLYIITGNGGFDASNGTSPNNDYGDSFLKLTGATLRIADWFTPSDQANDAANDNDFGAGGAAILVDQPSGPVPHLVIGGGKDGYIYLLNRDSLGHLADQNAWQRFNLAQPIFSTGAFWKNTFFIAGDGAVDGVCTRCLHGQICDLSVFTVSKQLRLSRYQPLCFIEWRERGNCLGSGQFTVLHEWLSHLRACSAPRV